MYYQLLYIIVILAQSSKCKQNAQQSARGGITLESRYEGVTNMIIIRYKCVHFKCFLFQLVTVQRRTRAVLLLTAAM